KILSIPVHHQVVRDEVMRLLEDTQAPVAVLCRSTFLVQPVMESLDALKLRVGADVHVVDLQHSGEEPCVIPSIVPEWSGREQIVALAKLLVRLCDEPEL